MRLSFVLISLVAWASSVAATFDKACPFPSLLVPVHNKCVCWLGLGTVPFNPGCTAVIKRKNYEERCESTCTAPPHPSHKPKPKRNQPILMPDGTLSRCPASMTACPLDAPPSLNGERATATISMSDPYECVKLDEDLYNCGGCSSTGKGVNCNTAAGVRGTSCNEGKCIIYTCQRGYKLVLSGDGAQECVRNTPRRM